MYYLINPYIGSILGPCETKEECEQQLILVECPEDWITVCAIEYDSRR